jgi:RHS repeat-associated protein
VVVEGDFYTQSINPENRIGENFILELKGNFYQLGVKAESQGAILFTGEGKQHLLMEEGGKSNENQYIKARMRRSPMGELSEYQNDPNPYRYNEQYYDHESGYIYLRARYYSPKLGRFLNKDPAKSENNWHTYGEGNPVLYEDSTGLFAVPVIGFLVIVLFTIAVISYTSALSMRNSTKIQAPPVNKRQVAVSTVLTAVLNWMLLGLTMTAVVAAGGTVASQRSKEVEAEKKQRQQLEQQS